MALQYNSNTVKALTYKGNDVKRLVYNGSVAWCKPFTVTVSTSHVASYTLMRTSHEEPSARIQRLTSGSTIYYNDHLTISATADPNYTMDWYATDYDVSGNLTISLSAHYSPIVQPLSQPSNCSFEWLYDDGEDSHYEAYMTNPNLVQCVLHYRFDDGYGWGPWLTTTIGAGATYSVEFISRYMTEGEAYLTANGYTDSPVTSFS